jgi:DNA invertase Pin-like site-specific DNA recombinase
MLKLSEPGVEKLLPRVRHNDFVNLIEAIERDEIDGVIIRDVDHLTRNLPDWSQFQ